jgi:two-component system, cell cycle sensor histidine kinase and response regulator CckA
MRGGGPSRSSPVISGPVPVPELDDGPVPELDDAAASGRRDADQASVGASSAAAVPVADEGYRRLFESHPAPMAIWDPATGRIIAANEAAVLQYGYGADELVGLTVDRIVHPDDLTRLREQVPNLPSGLAGAASFRHLRRNGEVIEVEMSGHPLEWEGRPARLVMAIDVTARHRLEQDLRSARETEAVGRLAGGIAHDFNNLVMAINGFAELLLDRLPAASDEHAAAIEIRTAGLRAAGLTSQLLAFARPHEPKPTRFELNELVEGLDATLRSISGPNVTVRIAATASRTTILADRDQIARAIVGCVLNARDAMPDGGQLRVETIDVEPAVASQLTGAIGDLPFVGLAISDSGPTGGVPSEEPTLAHRTGIGLALLYSTVQLAGGRIRLESTPGHGSTVRILLPLAGPGLLADDADDAPADRPAVASGDLPQTADLHLLPSRQAADGGEVGRSDAIDPTDAQGAGPADEPLVIAVVEDEPGVRTLVERILVRGGYRVVAFPDGGSAIDALADPRIAIDLLITDLVMPGPNGIEAARRIRRGRPGLPVILMSGFAADALRAEGVDETSIELLAKPFSAAELLEQIAVVLGRRSAVEG